MEGGEVGQAAGRAVDMVLCCGRLNLRGLAVGIQVKVSSGQVGAGETLWELAFESVKPRARLRSSGERMDKGPKDSQQ